TSWPLRSTSTLKTSNALGLRGIAPPASSSRWLGRSKRKRSKCSVIGSRGRPFNVFLTALEGLLASRAASYATDERSIQQEPAGPDGRGSAPSGPKCEAAPHPPGLRDPVRPDRGRPKPSPRKGGAGLHRRGDPLPLPETAGRLHGGRAAQ